MINGLGKNIYVTITKRMQRTQIVEIQLTKEKEKSYHKLLEKPNI